jgi:hypothetical protein
MKSQHVLGIAMRQNGSAFPSARDKALPLPAAEVTMSKRRKKLHGTVQKIIKPLDPSQPEKAQIDIQGADHLYREIRIDSEMTDEKGDKAQLKERAEVEVIVEADSSATLKKAK